MTNIKRARLARGLSKQQASARADVHPVTFAKAERGEPVTEVVAFKISRALGLKLEDVETVETTNSEAQRTAV